MNVTALRSALAAALDALDQPGEVEPEPAPDVTEVIAAEAEADATRIAAEAEAAATIIEAQAQADVEVIEAAAEAEAAAEVEVIEAEAEAEDEAYECDGELGELVPDLDALGELVDDAVDVLDAPLDEAPVIEPDVPPAATHWYTRRRTFGRR